MAFWNFTHGVLHMHVWLLPAIVAGIIMVVTGLIHGRNQKKRQEKYEEELRGDLAPAPAEEQEAAV